jgi:hypothetical protein
MIRTFLTVTALSALLLACPKNTGATSTLGGSDDEKMDAIAAQLEELRTRTETSCSETCSLKSKVCGLSETACDVAGRHADRADFQQRCVTAQEECARFNEACSACKK